MFKSDALPNIDIKGDDQINNLISSFDRYDYFMRLNFVDYLFLRRSNLAWGECASDGTIGSNKMNTALHITSPTRIL